MTTHTPRPADPRRALGDYGERLAERHLVAQGMVILDRQWRCEHGEIDLVAQDGDCLVVCEVKTRTATGFGEPVEAVTWAKLLRLRRLSWAYRQATRCPLTHARIDVIGVLRPRSGPATLRHVTAVGS